MILVKGLFHHPGTLLSKYFMPREFYTYIKNHAETRPNHPAIIDGDSTLTYSQLLEEIERFAGGLENLDIGPDSKLGLLCLNQKEYLVAFLGALLKGLPVVPYNFMLTPEDLVYITQDAGVDLFVMNPAFIKPETARFFAFFKHRILTSPPPPGLLPESGTVGFSDFVSQADPKAAHTRHKRNPEIPDVIMYTSGTTAKPKGVMLDENMFDANTAGVGEHLQFVPEDRAIMALPLFHSFGNIIALVFLRAGGTLILLQQFHPKTILGTIAEQRATVLPLVPTIYSFLVQLAEQSQYDTSSLKYCISGGAALPHALLHKVESVLGATVLEGYGLTEVSPVVAVNTMADGSIPGSVGPVLPNVQVNIVDDSETPVPPGEVGEIYVKGETVMRGYWKLTQETEEVITPDGWLRTGDLGHLDEAGRLFISAGRKKDLIIRAGENVSPLAIENVLINHTEVLEAAAIGIPHHRLGEQVVACVTLKAANGITENDLKENFRGKLPAFMLPDQIRFYESLPKNPTGKIMKTQLREDCQSKFNPEADTSGQPAPHPRTV